MEKMEDILKVVSDDYLKNKEILVKSNFPKGFVAFGSARIPMSDQHMLDIVEISKLCAKRVLEKKKRISFITGGGPSVMAAWLKGAFEEGAPTSGITLILPHETSKDILQFCDKETSCIMSTFQARKALLLEYAKALIIFKGGYGTMDELFETLTLIKTGKIPKIPIFIYPADFYQGIKTLTASFVEEKTINRDEIDILNYVNTKEELIEKLYNIIDNDVE
jgi:uncharacterized protein (TIGR00730 family)